MRGVDGTESGVAEVVKVGIEEPELIGTVVGVDDDVDEIVAAVLVGDTIDEIARGAIDDAREVGIDVGQEKGDGGKESLDLVEDEKVTVFDDVGGLNGSDAWR